MEHKVNIPMDTNSGHALAPKANHAFDLTVYVLQGCVLGRMKHNVEHFSLTTVALEDLFPQVVLLLHKSLRSTSRPFQLTTIAP